jgi:LacI family transcriptional regulator
MSGASLTEVARVGGVSLATASRVLNPDNTHPVSDDVRARVEAAAERLNFSVNGLARGLKVKRTNTVAAIVHDFCDPYFNAVARGITDAAEAAGYLTVLCNSARDPDKELRYLQLARQQRVAGVLFAGGGLSSRPYREAMRRQIATLRSYGAHAIALEPRGSRMPAEIPDNVGGARQGTEHLLALGHRRIAFIDGPAEVLTSRDRLRGHREALEAAGLRFDDRLVAAGGFSEEGGRAALAGLLESAPPFTAVFASNDAMAVGCMVELRSRGIDIPGRMSLVGFDDIPTVRWFDPPLTTVRVPMVEIGAAGVARLLTLLHSDDEAHAGGRLANVHPCELIVRASTAPPPTTPDMEAIT